MTSHENDNSNQYSEAHERKKLSNEPNGFVLGPSSNPSDQGISAEKNQVNKTSGVYNQTTEEEHHKALLEHLTLDFGNLLNQTDISDCYLNVRGTFMAVHKCILAARSTVFRAVISSKINNLSPKDKEKIDSMNEQIETAEQNKKLVLIIKKTTPDTMKKVVIFMYTGTCELDEGNCYALLDAAGRYDIKDLKLHTGRFIANRITKANVLMLIKAAYKYKNKLIQQCCIEYFIDNAKQVMEVHELWKKFAEENKEIVADLLHWLVNKDKFFEEKPQWEAKSHW